jgi:uroporphyrinogen-III synthase
MSGLQGVGVLVTRPEQQALPLCRLLEAQGADVMCLPVVDIKPLEAARSLYGTASADDFDLAVFVSANAVRYGARLLAPRHPQIAAIGGATARALREAGYRVAIMPVDGADTESLLAHPDLQGAAGRRVLLVKGENGRDLLRRGLEERGAAVRAVDVYRRERAVPDAGRLAVLERWLEGHIRVITATSVEIASSVLALAAGPLRPGFERATWLVASARIGRAVREQGLAAPLLQAASAQDHDLVAALLGWRASASGA